MDKEKCLTWNVSTPDTICMPHLCATSNSAGAAAAHSAVLKGQKYNALSPTFHFVAIARETLGPWNVEELNFIRELGRRTALVTNDTRETNFLLQRVSVAVQLGNVASVVGTKPDIRGDN